MSDRALTVLHVYKDVSPEVAGGIERHIDLLRRSVPDVTTNVLVCSRRARTRVRATDTGVEVAVGELGRVLSTPLAPTFPAWLRRLPADVIHLHMPNPTGEVSVLMARQTTPTVVTYHADIVRQARLLPAYAPVVRRCLRRATTVICGTAGIARSSPFLQDIADKVRVIPYGIDTGFFSASAVSAPDVAAVRARMGSPLVVATGRLVYYKGFERLIDLADQLQGSLAILGGGPLEDELRRRAASRPNVTIVGEVTDEQLRTCLAAADCFVLAATNHAESFGIATVEAQAMGVPAVVTDVGTGTLEAIRDGISGIGVPAADPRALVAAINAVITDTDRRSAMSVAASVWARERFGLDATAEAHARVYRAVA